MYACILIVQYRLMIKYLQAKMLAYLFFARFVGSFPLSQDAIGSDPML